MKKFRAPKTFIAMFLAVCVLITALEGYFLYENRRAALRDAMATHISGIINNVNFVVERLYSVQALIVAMDGNTVNLDDIVPVLNKDDPSQFLRCISIAPNGIVTQVYPLADNEALLGTNFYSNDHPFAKASWQTLRTGKPAVTTAFTLPNGEQVASIRLAVQLQNEKGQLQDWGIVSAAVSFPDILRDVTKNPLEEQGYVYRLSIQNNVRSEKLELFCQGSSNFTNPLSTTFFLVDQRLVLEAVPEQGWLTLTELALNFLRIAGFLLLASLGLALVLQQIRQLRVDASQDALTGLLNRASGRREVEHIMNGKSFSKGAFLMLDLDNFKNVNDTFGHERGDETLVKCAEQLRLLFRDSDVVCRFGGDEFMIFLPFQSDMSFLNDKIERLLRAMRRDVVGDDAIVSISASVGIAIAPDHGDTFDELYRHADEALYRSKQRGRDVATIFGEFVYHPNTDFSPADFSFRSRDCILIIDDDFINREVLKNIFSKQYRFEEATDGLEGLQKIKEHLPHLSAILLDVNMPGMSGIELLTILHQQGVPFVVPVFLVTSYDDMSIAQEAYELGVMDVIAKPVTPFVILRRVQSVIELYQARAALSKTVQDQAKSLQESLDTIDALHRGTIEVLADAIEFRSMESGAHINRIYGITKQILTHTPMGEGFSPEEVENMAIGSIMHDVGKIAVSDMILNKPGKLTKEEFELMKTHTTKGAELMERLSQTQNHPAYSYAQDITRHHHERWDGKGYPDGLKGNEISVWAQVVSIADVYDALLSPRVYKPAYAPDEAVAMICNGECGTFNPKLLECFLMVEPEIRKWYTGSGSEGHADTASRQDMPTAPAAPQAREQELADVLLLTAAVQSAYDMIICANLTKNSYYMMDYERFLTHSAESDGVFDDLIAAGAASIPESHRQKFMDTFSRSKLLEAHARGEKSVHLVHPQYSDDGTLLNVATSVLFMEDPRNGDIRQITLARYL